MDNSKQLLEELAQECEAQARSSRKFGRRYHYASYALIIVSLSGSIGAALLAFLDQVDRDLVGVVALLPAISASIAGQLRTVEKSSWFYRRKHAMERLVRDLRLAAATDADLKVVETANQRRAELDDRFESDWDTGLAFRFQTQESGGQVKGN